MTQMTNATTMPSLSLVSGISEEKFYKDITLEKTTKNQLNTMLGNDQLKYIKKMAMDASYHFIVQVSKLPKPEPIYTGEGKYKYRAKLRIEQITPISNLEAEEIIDRDLMPKIERAAKFKDWVIVNETPNQNIRLASVTEFELPILNDKIFHTVFGRIYERDAQIRAIYDSAKTFVKTEKRVRSHILLYGKPAAAKTSIFETFKLWFENTNKGNCVAVLDATTLTKAGLEKWLIKRAQKLNMPIFLCIEELEKHQPENLLCLLSIMDHRARMDRTNSFGSVSIKAPVIVWGTCNDEKILKEFKNGALWSRFTHKWYCARPSKKATAKILRDHCKDMELNQKCAKAAIDFGYDVLNTNDPRELIGLLDGGDRLLDESYQSDLLTIIKAERMEKKKDEENEHQRVFGSI